MKKFLLHGFKIVLMTTFIFSISSCKNEKKDSSYTEEFLQTFNQIYPNGYELKDGWYSYSSTTIATIEFTKEKEIINKDFQGYVSFKKSDLIMTSKFVLKETHTKMKDDMLYETLSITSSYDGTTYCRVEETMNYHTNETYKKSQGMDLSISLPVSYPFKEYYNHLKEDSFAAFSIKAYHGPILCVVTQTEKDEGNTCITEEYYFDYSKDNLLSENEIDNESYNFKKMTQSMQYESNISTKESYISVCEFTLSKETSIEVRRDYDETLTLPTDFSLKL